MTARGTLQCFFLLVVLGTAAAAPAAAPALIPVQGLLTDTSGLPVDNLVSVHFILYDARSGGNELWSETQNLQVSRGLFSTTLGSINPLDLVLFRNEGEVWLAIRVGSDPEGQRIRLGSTPFTAYAQHSSHTAGSGIAITADNVISSSLGASVEGNEITDGSITIEDIAAGTLDVPLVILRHIEVSGVHGGDAVSGSWQTRFLNTESVDTHDICSLSSNQFTIPAGTYEIDAWATMYRVNTHRIRLFDVSNSQTMALGSNTHSSSSSYVTSSSVLRDRFSIGAQTTFRIEYRCDADNTANGLGQATGWGDPELYAEVALRKIDR